MARIAAGLSSSIGVIRFTVGLCCTHPGKNCWDRHIKPWQCAGPDGGEHGSMRFPCHVRTPLEEMWQARCTWRTLERSLLRLLPSFSAVMKMTRGQGREWGWERCEEVCPPGSFVLLRHPADYRSVTAVETAYDTHASRPVLHCARPFPAAGPGALTCLQQQSGGEQTCGPIYVLCRSCCCWSCCCR